MAKDRYVVSTEEYIEVDAFDDNEELNEERLMFTSSYYLQNIEEIEALNRYILGSNNLGIPSRKTSNVELAIPEEIPA